MYLVTHSRSFDNLYHLKHDVVSKNYLLVVLHIDIALLENLFSFLNKDF